MVTSKDSLSSVIGASGGIASSLLLVQGSLSALSLVSGASGDFTIVNSRARNGTSSELSLIDFTFLGKLETSLRVSSS